MITTLCGSNAFMVQKELKKRTGEFVKAHSDMGLERYDGEELEPRAFAVNLQAMPFLAGKRLIIVRNLSANKQLTEGIEQLLAGVPDTTDLILVEGKLDKRGSYYKTLKKQTEFLEYGELDAPQLATWLVREAADAGGTLTSADARFLVERVGTNQLLLSNELQKILAYDPNVTRKTIELLSDQSPQSTVFQMLDAAFAGNVKRALQMYQEQRQLKVEPQALIGLISWQLHSLVVVKAAGNRPADEIARAAKLNPFVVRKSQGLVRSLSMQRLKALVAEALSVDVRLKTENIDPDDAMQYLLIKIADI